MGLIVFKEQSTCPFICDFYSVSQCMVICLSTTVNSEKIALVESLRFLVFSLGRKIKIRNDLCCHFKSIAGTPCFGQFAKLKDVL